MRKQLNLWKWYQGLFPWVLFMWNMTKLYEELGRNYLIPGLLPSWISDIIIWCSFYLMCCCFLTMPFISWIHLSGSGRFVRLKGKTVRLIMKNGRIKGRCHISVQSKEGSNLSQFYQIFWKFIERLLIVPMWQEKKLVVQTLYGKLWVIMIIYVIHSPFNHLKATTWF